MSEDIDQMTDEKQNYLRQNILDKGYDGNQFINFLIEKRGEDGADISNWSFPDLKAVVKEFIDLNPQKAIENDEKENKENELYGIKNFNEIECQTIPNNEITKCENVQIKIDSFEKVKGNNIFSKSYATYLIITMPFNWKVRRRFSDFEWLHQILKQDYKYCLIPSIPKKKNINKLVADKFDEAFLRKRSRKFEKFLNYLINDPILKNMNVVYEFLSIEKDEDFQKKKKSYEKKKPSSNINDFISIDGKANIEINKEKENCFNNIKENANNNGNILKKINSKIISCKDDLINASNKLKDISKNWNNMKNLAISEKDDVIKTYEELSLMFGNLSLYISKLNYIIYVYLREYFKYVKNNYHSMKDLISAGESIKNNFYKSLKHLILKKEDLFKKPESIDKWDFNPEENIDKNEIVKNKELSLEKMLYNETNGVNNQKQLYGFYLNRVISEYERMKEINAEMHLAIVLKIFEKQTDATTDFITSLADNSTDLTISRKDAKKLKKEKKAKTEVDEEILDLEIKK